MRRNRELRGRSSLLTAYSESRGWPTDSESRRWPSSWCRLETPPGEEPPGIGGELDTRRQRLLSVRVGGRQDCRQHDAMEVLEVLERGCMACVRVAVEPLDGRV